MNFSAYSPSKHEGTPHDHRLGPPNPPNGAETATKRARARDTLEQAVAAGAELIVLPELVPSGYFFEDAEEARSLAETPDGPTVRERWPSCANGQYGTDGGLIRNAMETECWPCLANGISVA
jgi:hypothetical protein